MTLERFPVVECGEPLVEVDERFPHLASYRTEGWPGTDSRCWLRRSVVERLHVAADALPPGHGLAIFDGWRSMTTVRALYAHFYGPGSTLEPGFLADPDDPEVVPPHTTGAAVDLTLTFDGDPLWLGTEFDDFGPRAAAGALEHEGESAGPARARRRLLTAAMEAAGFAPYAPEWWHFSFGDQAWSEATGAASARYGPVEPGT
jgi:D-alanyl-D-alanine dipeptidase